MIVVIVSGEGTNFEALVKGLPHKSFLLVSNRPAAGALKRAERLGVPAIVVDSDKAASREEHDEAMLKAIATAAKDVELIVLAGYMRVLSKRYFEVAAKLFKDTKTVNIHPAHREDYKGAVAYKFAVRRLFPRWGLTVHEVTPELDSGPLIFGAEFPVLPWDDETSLKSRLILEEHKLLVTAVQRLTERKAL